MLITGSFLLTHLSPSTSTPTLWLWLALTGLGIGPSMSVFTVVIQNAAPRERLGTATSTLTFLRQVGGVVGLAVAGTVFSQNLSSQLPKQMSAAHLPSQLTAHITGSGAFSENNIASVGNLGQTILQAVPAAARPAIQPFLGQIVGALHNAMSLALGGVFWVALVGAVLGFLATLVIRELPLRSSGRAAGARRRDPGRGTGDEHRRLIAGRDRFGPMAFSGSAVVLSGAVVPSRGRGCPPVGRGCPSVDGAGPPVGHGPQPGTRL